MSNGAELADQTCVPCRGGVPPLASEQANELLKRLDDGWQVVETHHLRRDFRFKDFLQAMDFVNRAGAVAEEQGHHPEITVGWGHANVEIWTHKIDGLTESDFILAAKFDKLTP